MDIVSNHAGSMKYLFLSYLTTYSSRKTQFLKGLTPKNHNRPKLQKYIVIRRCICPKPCLFPWSLPPETIKKKHAHCLTDTISYGNVFVEHHAHCLGPEIKSHFIASGDNVTWQCICQKTCPLPSGENIS